MFRNQLNLASSMRFRIQISQFSKWETTLNLTSSIETHKFDQTSTFSHQLSQISKFPSEKLMKYSNEKDMIDFYLLPTGMVWPFFEQGGKRMSEGPNILFHKTDPVNLLRETYIVDRVIKWYKSNSINKPPASVTLGLPGLGKSADMNFLLLKFLPSLKDGTIPKIYLMICHRLLTVTYNESSGFKVLQEILSHQQAARRFQHEVDERNDQPTRTPPPLLMIELDEEATSCMAPTFPIIVTSASEKADRVFNLMYKSLDINYLFMEHPSIEQVETMVRVLDHYGYLSPDNTFQTIMNRAKDIGTGDLRALFSKGNFNTFLEFLNGIDMSHFKLSAVDFSIFNIPHAIQLLLGPKMKPDVFRHSVPFAYRSLFYLECLSPLAKQKLLSLTTSPDVIDFLDRYGSRSQVQEHIAAYALLNDNNKFPLPSELRINQWIWFEGSRLTNSQRTHPSPPQRPILKCDSLSTFSPQHVHLTINNIPSNVLFNFKVSNNDNITSLVDLLMVDQTQKRLFLFQIRSLQPKDHAIDILTWRNLLARLDLHNIDNADYYIDFIYLTSEKPSSPITFNNLNLPPSSKIQLLDDPMNSNRVRFFVVQAKLDLAFSSFTLDVIEHSIVSGLSDESDDDDIDRMSKPQLKNILTTQFNKNGSDINSLKIKELREMLRSLRKTQGNNES